MQHEQNGRAERDIRTIVESARSILLLYNTDKSLWTEAISTACYVLNRTVPSQGGITTPFQKFFSYKPNILHLQTFGVQAYVNIPKEGGRKKFDHVSKKVIFVGYDNESTN